MPKYKICKQCGKVFIDKYSDGKIFCNRKCYAEWKRGRPNAERRDYGGEGNPNWRGGNIRVCLNCGESFVDKHYDGKKFCGRKCYGEHKHKINSTTFQCIICGKEVEILKHDKGKRKYCSHRCMGLDTKKPRLSSKKKIGWKMSTEARQKVSIAASNRQVRNSWGKSGWYESAKAGGKVYYRSSYEKRAFELLDANSDVVSYEVEPFVIVYIDRFADTRRYRPDVLVHWDSGYNALVEIKPAWQLDNPEVLEKLTSGAMYARSHGMNFEIWTEWALGLGKCSTGAR